MGISQNKWTNFFPFCGERVIYLLQCRKNCDAFLKYNLEWERGPVENLFVAYFWSLFLSPSTAGKTSFISRYKQKANIYFVLFVMYPQITLAISNSGFF